MVHNVRLSETGEKVLRDSKLTYEIMQSIRKNHDKLKKGESVKVSKGKIKLVSTI